MKRGQVWPILKKRPTRMDHRKRRKEILMLLAPDIEAAKVTFQLFVMPPVVMLLLL